jgi:hypothetical protein
MYSWMALAGLIVFILCLFIIYREQGAEGFVTQDSDTLKAQRQLLQFEQEHRSNDLARVMSPSSTLSPDSVNKSIFQAIPTSSTSTTSLTTLVAQSLGFGGIDDRSSKSGPGVENTGMVQDKINFCESLPVDCDFSDPRMAECGMCLKDGISSTGKKMKGGMYISSEDQIRANQVAAANGTFAQYKPTVGTCNPAFFVVEKEMCLARQNQLECANTTAVTDSNKCGQCFGSAGPLLYVGAKPRSFNAILNVSHPGVYGPMRVTYGSTTAQVESSTKTILDPTQVALKITEGDTIKILINGFPKVWCAWLSSTDGKRNVSIDVGEQAISPDKAIGVIGDKRSMKISSALSKESGYSAFSTLVPNTVMWYGRLESMNGIPISAKYGTTDVLAKVLSLGGSQDISVPTDLGVKTGSSASTLVVKLDNGRNYFIPDGSSLKGSLLQNSVTITLQCPATLDDPYYQMDLQACPTGPIVFTPAGAGMMGSHSCYKADGSFNPSVFCLQELFTGAGGTEHGTLYPNDQVGADAIVQKNSSGQPDLDLTSAFLNDLGSKAIYGTDGAGKPASLAEFKDASMKMLGTSPKNMCDGPNKNTGPHLPACLDYLWRTSGNPGSDSTNYSFCSAAGKLAPLNPDGSPNEQNVAAANDMGSVTTVQAYYKSIFDAAQNTKDFSKWSIAMSNCYNASVQEPTFDPASCDPPSVPGINIISATYGKNCNGVIQGNRTKALQNLANGKDSFQYSWDYNATGGDPAGGCGKNLDIIYNCSGGPTKNLHIERPEGEEIDINCSPSATAVKGINILDATYGKNCTKANVGNRTRFFKGLAQGKPSLDYTYNYTQSGGDPHPGCYKQLDINYTCDGGPPQTLHFAGEAGYNSQVSISCEPATLIAWFDASDINGDGSTLPNKSVIKQWVDKSGKGNHAVRGNWGKDPIILNNAQNNLSVVDVNGGTQMNFNLGTSTSKYSIFTVQYARGAGWSRLLNGMGSKGVDGYLYYGLGPATNIFYTMLGDGAWQGKESNNPQVSLNGRWSQVDLITNGSSSISSADGTIQQRVTWTPLGALNGINIGSHGNGGQEWTGMIAEIMVFTGTLNSTQAQTVRNNLRKKWGI